ncbi:serine/threonine-protein kinase [Haliangium ochraceum]|uniref:Serine/threonine protein kinase n=1 Tax=Haliangium ochraceum (strain DSM 14365 / JCM 11303 / SMP-2) TaxID=502025 RepID=D0LWM6_HALO1|nr:serine/threonine-protein kinase [Haliangium ochraceum]ACY17676.1 serine/threonine protein kinase [Haliangium ochraceum DSM 14365]
MAEPAQQLLPAPACEDPLVGTRLGDRFLLRALLGIGAYGRVYRAEQVNLQRDVAIKVLEPRLAHDKDFVEQLYAEALITSRLSHPNVVSIIDFGRSEDGLVYIVMEYLRGLTLTDLLSRTWPMPLSRVGNILRQILFGLEEAHASDIVHADLKSDNILVEQRSRGDLVKVVDFGIARLLDPVLPWTHAASPHVSKISGTPEYMAPEVIRGQKPSFAADIYAAGIVLYQLLVGRPPFEHQSFMQVLRSHIEEPIPSLAVMRADAPVPAAWEHLLHRALAKSPAARFESATAFREELDEALEAAVEAEAADGRIVSALGVGPSVMCVVDELGEDGDLEEIELPDGDDSQCDDPARRHVTIETRRHTLESASATLSPMDDIDTERFDTNERVPVMRSITQGTAMATALDFCLGGGSRYALQLTAPRSEIASAIVATTLDRLGSGVCSFISRPDVALSARRWHPIRQLLCKLLDLPFQPDEIALHAAAVGLGTRAKEGLFAVFRDAEDTGAAPTPRAKATARTWSIARAVREAALATRKDGEQLLLWFDEVHRFDTESCEVLRVLCAGYLSGDLRAMLSAEEPFDIAIAEGVTRVVWEGDAEDEIEDRDEDEVEAQIELEAPAAQMVAL